MSDRSPQPAADPAAGAAREARLAEALGHATAKRWDKAEKVLQAIVGETPRDAGAWDLLGYAAYSAGRARTAKDAFGRAVALAPSSAAYRVHLGAACRALGEIDEAIAHYRRALQLAPDEPTALGNLGNALRQQGKLDEAIVCYGKCVSLAPDSVPARVNLAAALVQARRHDRALYHLREALRRDPRSAEACKGMGNALFGKADYRGAVEAYDRAVELGARDHEVHHNAATALQYLGRMDEAESHYRKAVALRPDASMTLRQLAGVKRFESADAELRHFESLLASATGARQRADVYFGLAKAYDDLGRYDEAFACLQAGNQIVRMDINYSAGRTAAQTDRVIATFRRGFFAKRRGWGLDSDLPVFVVGMPRSGTTLVEQILASHPRVFGAGELTRLFELANDIPRRAGMPDSPNEAVAALGRPAWRELASEYLAHLRSFDAEAARITDKMPFNFRLLGMAAVMFPNARIIHCLRDPLDTCLSCYFTAFRDTLSFSFNLIELGRYYLDYRRLMAHWRRVLPLPMLEVRYEDLVADQETVSRRIVAFCGLEWDDRCLEFHRTERPVLTASTWQVRQPIYATSVGRARHYARQLAPLSAVLRRAGALDGGQDDAAAPDGPGRMSP